VALAARGARLTSNKAEQIEDKREVLKIRWQALRVIIKGTLAGVAMTALVMLIP
jgi:hypothetical protein